MTPSESKRQIESDLDRARERLSFYEQFDEIIKQNISSSSALLREASARFDSDFAEERRSYRALLSDILDELTVLQSHSERLARRVTDALDELENKLPAPGEATPLVAASSRLATQAAPEAAAVVNAAALASKKPEQGSPIESGAPAAVIPPPTKRVAAAEPPAKVVPPMPGSASTTLLIHGMPRAAAALGLKSYIEKLDFVTTVEPREFAAGLLRLQVDGARPLLVDDLSGWSLANRIELKNASNELLELNLAPA